MPITPCRGNARIAVAHTRITSERRVMVEALRNEALPASGRRSVGPAWYFHLHKNTRKRRTYHIAWWRRSSGRATLIPAEQGYREPSRKTSEPTANNSPTDSQVPVWLWWP